MEWMQNPLKIDPSRAVSEITGLILGCMQNLNRKIAVIGLSGGLDSSLATALTVKALGPENVQVYYLPEVDSKPIHAKHAKLVSEQLGLDLRTISISPALRALNVYNLLPLRFVPGRKLKNMLVDYGKGRFLKFSEGEFLNVRLKGKGGYWLAKGNAYASAKHRVRSVALYKEAEKQRGLVVGAANKTEWLTGTFILWGCDHCADIMPLIHLYRSQLEVLADYLKLPPVILAKKADPDILPGLDDKGSLLGSFKEADLILWGLQQDISQTELESQFGKDRVMYIRDLLTNSAYYRETPYTLIPTKTVAH